jgi:hypothetical protein
VEIFGVSVALSQPGDTGALSPHHFFPMQQFIKFQIDFPNIFITDCRFGLLPKFVKLASFGSDLLGHFPKGL